MKLAYRFHNARAVYEVEWTEARVPTWNDLRAHVAATHRIRMLDYGPNGRMELVARLRPWESEAELEDLGAPLAADHEFAGGEVVVVASRRVTSLHIDHPYMTPDELAEWRLFFQVIYRPMKELADRMPWPLFLLNIRTGHFNPFAMKRLANAPMPSYSREGEEEYWERVRDRRSFRPFTAPLKNQTSKRSSRRRCKRT